METITPDQFLLYSGIAVLIIIVVFALLTTFIYFCCYQSSESEPETQKVIHMGGMEVVDNDDRRSMSLENTKLVDLDYVNDRNRTYDYGTWIQPNLQYNCYTAGPIRQSD